MFPERIETERLLLRRPRLADADAIFRNYASDPEVTLHLKWTAHESVAETMEFLAYIRDEWRDGREYAWAICERGSPDVVGMIAARMLPPKADVGYVLARPLWGRGYMTEAVRAVADTLLDSSLIWRVWAWCDVANVASARVLEKAGMTHEGTLRRWERAGRDAPVDCHVFARVR